MRISDWSSDVCSSDLQSQGAQARGTGSLRTESRQPPPDRRARQCPGPALQRVAGAHRRLAEPDLDDEHRLRRARRRRAARTRLRSEEHTSELQSLMRISYAVFCLKKKKKH